MTKKTRKHAFTVVELVIVIAVVAILAAVLIPTYANLVKKANEATALVDAKNAVTEMLANILDGGDDAADIIVLSKKGTDIYVYGYSAEAGRIITYKGNPVSADGGFDAVIAELAKNGAISDDSGAIADWRKPDSIKEILKQLNFDENTTMIYATYTINIKLFEKSNEEPPVAHTCSASTLTKIAGIAATCKAKGYSDCYVCSCGKWYSDADASTEISGRPEIAVNPNAHVAGSTWLSDDAGHWHVCALCNTAIDKVSHSMSNGVCTVCGYKAQAETSGTTASTSTSASTSASAKPAETTATTTTPHVHEWSDWSTVEAPTCTVSGSQMRKCSCGATETKPIPATGNHNWGDGKVTTPATCTETGVKTYTCTGCKTTKTETISATGHTVVTDAAVAATCKETGKTEGSHCEACNKVIKAQTVTPITFHTYDASGNCSVCGQGKAALEDLKRTDIHGDKNITLTSDLTLTLGDAKYSELSKTYYFSIYAGKDSDGKYGTTTLNLHGHTLTVDVDTVDGIETYSRFFYGNLKITGSGKIIYKGKAALFTRTRAAFGNNQYSISADDDVKFIGIKDGVEVELNKEPECKCDTYANSFYTHPDFGKHNFIGKDTCRNCGAAKPNS